MGEEPEDDGEDDADDEAGDDGEVEGGVFAAVDDVAGKAAEGSHGHYACLIDCLVARGGTRIRSTYKFEILWNRSHLAAVRCVGLDEFSSLSRPLRTNLFVGRDDHEEVICLGQKAARESYS